MLSAGEGEGRKWAVLSACEGEGRKWAVLSVRRDFAVRRDLSGCNGVTRELLQKQTALRVRLAAKVLSG